MWLGVVLSRHQVTFDLRPSTFDLNTSIFEHGDVIAATVPYNMYVRENLKGS
jgi:hypothetical protein